jgi:DNA-binding response OmpR family regulator
VDDEPAISALARISLEQTGLYEVVVEDFSSKALATARHFRPQIILLDVNMPGKDGGDVAAEIRSDIDLAGTAILFLTSLVSPEEAEDQEPSPRGGNFLSKRAAPAVLLRAVASVLARASAAKPIRLVVPNGQESRSPEHDETVPRQVPHYDPSGF